MRVDTRTMMGNYKRCASSYSIHAEPFENYFHFLFWLWFQNWEKLGGRGPLNVNCNYSDPKLHVFWQIRALWAAIKHGESMCVCVSWVRDWEKRVHSHKPLFVANHRRVTAWGSIAHVTPKTFIRICCLPWRIHAWLKRSRALFFIKGLFFGYWSHKQHWLALHKSLRLLLRLYST